MNSSGGHVLVSNIRFRTVPLGLDLPGTRLEVDGSSVEYPCYPSRRALTMFAGRQVDSSSRCEELWTWSKCR